MGLHMMACILSLVFVVQCTDGTDRFFYSGHYPDIKLLLHVDSAIPH